MVTFLPFKGCRPSLAPGEGIADRVSPPYDVIGPERLAELRSKKGNVTNLTLAPDADRRYRGSRRLLDEMVADGSLKADPPSFYLYEQTFEADGEKVARRGIVGILKTEEYSEGGVMPHEETFSKVKADRLNLLRDMEAHLESIFGICPPLPEGLGREIDAGARLLYRYVDPDGVEHRYSRIGDEGTCARITEALKDAKMLIADGHHRYETALNYAKENPGSPEKQFVLCTMVPSDDPGLVVWPTHRLVDAGDIGERAAIKKIESRMACEEVPADRLLESLPGHLFGMAFGSGRCLLADNRPESCEGLLKLDTYSVQENVLNGVYKADEGKSKVSFDADAESAMKSVADGEHDAAVLLNPPNLETIWDFAEQGLRMPKKTTYFFPKIWSGWAFYMMHRNPSIDVAEPAGAGSPASPFSMERGKTQTSDFRIDFQTGDRRAES